MKLAIATRSRYPHGPTPQRMELFRRVTVPSLIGQTDHDFTWLLTVSDYEHGQWISEVVKDFRGQIVMRTSADLSMPHEADVRMARLDDDDALASDYVARLRAAGPHTPNRWYVFPNGFRAYNGLCEPYRNPANQFIARDVPNGSSATVYEIKHGQVLAMRDFNNVDDRSAWLFVRHNQSRTPGGRTRTTQPIESLTQFAIDHEFLKGVR